MLCSLFGFEVAVLMVQAIGLQEGNATRGWRLPNENEAGLPLVALIAVLI